MRTSLAPASGSCPDSVVLSDGRSASIRPIQVGDLARHSRFVSGLSTRSGYARLLSMRKPDDAELRRWTDIDHAREAALIATVSCSEDDEEIGVARYVRESEVDGLVTAGFAVVIADAWQGVGLARELLQRVIAAARRDGIDVLSDFTQYDNRAMLSLAKKLGFTVRRFAADGANVTRLTFRLTPGKP